MWFENQKLIFESKEKTTRYYLAGFNGKSAFNNAKHLIYWTNDILLKGKVYTGFFKKEFNFSYVSLWEVYRELGKGIYTFDDFKHDLIILNSPKFCILYAERPPRKIKPRTQAEIDQDTLIAISACSNTAFL